MSTLIGEGLLGHEVVAGFDAHADVGLVGAAGEPDLVPELGVLRLVLDAVHHLDADLVWGRRQSRDRRTGHRDANR